jgi:hypothetical protein
MPIQPKDLTAAKRTAALKQRLRDGGGNRLSLNLDGNRMKKLDALIKCGVCANHSDAIRHAIDNADSCICHGAWSSIIKKSQHLLDRHFISYDKKKFIFIGFIYTADDFYYGMWSKTSGLRLLSCVGSIEGHGYTLIDEKSMVSRE